MNFLWLLALALPAQFLHPLVDYYQGLHCSPCPDEFKNYGLDPAQLSNGTFSAFENNRIVPLVVGMQDNGLTLRFTGTAIYLYLAVSAAANLPTPIRCSFILDSTDIPDGSHILNMDVGDTPVVFDYADYTSDTSEFEPPVISASAMPSSPAILPSSSTSAATITSAAATSSATILTSSSTSAATLTSAAATTSSATILTSSSPKKTLSIPLIAGTAAVGVALILALFAGFVLYHRARRTKAHAPDMEEGAGDGLVGNGNIQDHRGTASAAQMQQNQGGNEVPLPQLKNEVKGLEGTSNGTGSDIAPLVSTSMERSSGEGSKSASRARLLSMMKRDQTRALQDHEHGVGVGDTLVGHIQTRSLTNHHELPLLSPDPYPSDGPGINYLITHDLVADVNAYERGLIDHQTLLARQEIKLGESTDFKQRRHRHPKTPGELEDVIDVPNVVCLQPDLCFHSAALLAFQEAAEDYLVSVFEKTLCTAQHAHRDTIQAKDMVLVFRVRGARF
ncbi:hypothetical protein B0H14DRAFT_3871126 [Mycena olivaceomarginata]|nr:hypothetical protein B0H14DRAFT_3871126 [Mycena olivaceomarginata]